MDAPNWYTISLSAFRDVIGKVGIDYWHEWGTEILRPWIEADDDLRGMWRCGP